MARADYDTIYARWEQTRVALCHARRKQLVPYHLGHAVEPQHTNRGAPAPMDVPGVGCLVHRNNSGYGDCAEDTWIVERVDRARTSRRPKSVWVRRVYGLDMGQGPADAMPEAPAGHCAIDPDQPATELRPMFGGPGQECLWKERDTKAQHWGNADWSFGVYRPSCGGIDK